MPGNSAGHHHRQFARGPRDRRALYAPDIFICRDPAHCHRHRSIQNICCGRAPRSGDAWRAVARCNYDYWRVASAESVLQWMHGDDRRRSRQQRCAGISRAGFANRSAHSDGIIALLIVLLAGIAFLSRAYQIGATEPGPGYQSVLSQLTAAVVGRGAFYFVTIASILLVLSLSANTAFADFPRLCRLVAQDGFLPSPFAVRGRRLVYTQGIIVLGMLCAVLLTLFGGITDRLIPLYAIGAFLAFTLSQA